MRRLTIGLLFCVMFLPPAQGAGNHPEAGTCPADKPYFALCTHSLHNLEGWYSRQCHATPGAAKADAERHARDRHDGNMRWTGVAKTR